MVSMMSFMNLFMVPMTGLFLLLRRRGVSPTFSAGTLILYALFACWNVPVTHGFCVAARHFGLQALPESGWYTLFALASSLVVYGAAVLATEILKIEFTVEKK